ncbi:MAG: S8 family serine peptidase, partial [Luteimonas sp.]
VHLGAPGWEKTGALGDSSHLLEAIHFVVSEAAGRPLVLNMSIGRHAGPHDGSTLVEQAIDWLVRARPGTAVVQSTGNYYARNVHSAGQLHDGEVEELSFEVHPGDTTPNELEIWYSGRDVLRVALIAPDGSTVADVGQGDRAPVVVKGERVGTLYHRIRDPNNGDHHLDLFQYPNAPAGIWRVRLTGEDVSDGRYHAWLERDPGCRTCQALFEPAHADRSGTTGSICNGLQTIAVGAYDGHRPTRPLAPFSSSGPTRDGRVRPLLLAPGVRVLAARSHPRSGSASLLTRMSGTSMAAPHVTGTIALMLQAGGPLDIVQIRRALFDALTPTDNDAPRDRHRIGFGMLDTAKAVERAAAIAASARAAAPAETEPPPFAWHAPMPRDTRTAAAPPRARAELAPSTAHDAAETVVDAITPSGHEDIAMPIDCCGDACTTCEHCHDHDCATCPCCHDGATVAVASHGGETTAWPQQDTNQIVPSPLRGHEALSAPEDAFNEAGEPIVQIVPSPLQAETWSPSSIDETDQPIVQVVPSPLRAARETDAMADTDAADTAVEAAEYAAELSAEPSAEQAVEYADPEYAAYPHPVDAAEALV